MNQNADPKTMLAEYLGEKAADELLAKIIQMAKSGASVTDMGKAVKDAFDKHAPGKTHEEGCGTATTAGAAIGTAAGTVAGNTISK